MVAGSVRTETSNYDRSCIKYAKIYLSGTIRDIYISQREEMHKLEYTMAGMGIFFKVGTVRNEKILSFRNQPVLCLAEWTLSQQVIDEVGK